MQIATMTLYAGDSVQMYFNSSNAVNKYNGTSSDGTLTTSQVASTGYYVGTFTSDANDIGNTYLFAQGETDTSEAYVIQVISKTGILETAVIDATADDNPDSVLGRLLTVEKNQTDVLMPRMRRTLGLLGEHQLVDGFVYDDDGNITQCRLRIFETKAAAEAAQPWLDANGDETDTSMITDEIARYTIDATNSLPRNLRTQLRTRLTKAQPENPAGITPDEPYGSNGSNSGTNNGSVL